MLREMSLAGGARAESPLGAGKGRLSERSEL